MAQHTHFINSIVVIESLGEGPFTGTEIYDSVLRPLEFAKIGIEARLERPTDRSQFFEVLQSVYAAARDRGVRPILQIECHGTRDRKALSLASGETVSWRELGDRFREIHRAADYGLLAILAACHGEAFKAEMSRMEPFPAWGFIGPIGEVLPIPLETAIKAFYRSLAADPVVENALESMQSETGLPEGVLFISAERLFHLEYCRAVEMLDAARHQDEEHHNTIEEPVRTSDIDPRVMFDLAATRYFDLERQPANRTRFVLDYHEARAFCDALRAGRLT